MKSTIKKHQIYKKLNQSTDNKETIKEDIEHLNEY
jgi:hypothetical protein